MQYTILEYVYEEFVLFFLNVVTEMWFTDVRYAANKLCFKHVIEDEIKGLA